MHQESRFRIRSISHNKLILKLHLPSTYSTVFGFHCTFTDKGLPARFQNTAQAADPTTGYSGLSLQILSRNIIIQKYISLQILSGNIII